MHREPNRAGLTGDGARHALTNPPERIGGKFVATGGVKFLNGSLQAQGTLLNQVEQLKTFALIFLGNTDNQAEVRLHHSLFGTATDPQHPALLAVELTLFKCSFSILGEGHHRLDLVAEFNFFGGGQQRNATDRCQIPTHRVAAAAPLGIDGFRC